MPRRRRGDKSLSGILPIDKPVGLTSADVVRRVGGALKIARIGHCGTLDPFASGVLALVLNEGAKLAAYLTASTKVYETEILLGVVTDTLDVTGKVLDQRPVEANASAVEKVLLSLKGVRPQVPPMYSAKKINGVRLYELARRGEEVEREAKTVEVLSVDILSVALPTARFRIAVSSGTYIRSLCAEAGEMLGCGGVRSALRRVAAAGFGIEDCVTLEDALNAAADISRHLLPLNDPRLPLPILVLDEAGVRHAMCGQLIPASSVLKAAPPGRDGIWRAVDAAGEVRALLSATEEGYRSIRGFAETGEMPKSG